MGSNTGGAKIELPTPARRRSDQAIARQSLTGRFWHIASRSEVRYLVAVGWEAGVHPTGRVVTLSAI
jgi:hypothetical protein